MSESALKKYGVKPLARFVSFAVAGVPPEIMGIGPIKAIPKVLRRPASSRTTSTGSS
jgi:acetyl-CoA acyltransferase